MRVFFADSMSGTAYRPEKRAATLADTDIVIVDDPDQSDFIIARRLADLSPHFARGKRYHIWTREPPQLWEPDDHLFDVAHGVTISVSSAFNGDAYPTPLEWFPAKGIDVDRVMETAQAKSKHCVILASYRRDFARYSNGRNVDLCLYRQNLAAYLQTRHDACDIYGLDWPDGITRTGESRGGGWNDWHTEKLRILAPYRFNLAIENTIAPNYVTEKLWDAIMSGCVPVVYAASGISDILPAEAYIDCTGVTDLEQIADTMTTMSDAERLERVRLALSRFDDLSNTIDRREQRRELGRLLARRLAREATRPAGIDLQSAES